MSNVDFKQIGEGYSGKSVKGIPQIRLHFDESLASRVSYGDLCEKVYLQRSDSSNGQYKLLGLVKKEDQ